MPRYTTEALVEAEIGNSITGSTTPTSTQLTTWIDEAENLIDERIGTSFTSGTVTNAIIPFTEHTSYKSSQIIAAEGLRVDSQRLSTYDSVFLLNERFQRVKPIISISSLQINTAGSNIVADVWESMSQNSGSAGDFILDSEAGLVTFYQDKPTFGLQRGVRWSGNFGYTSTPLRVQMLATKLVARRILQMKAKASQFSSIDSISLESISINKRIGDTVTYLHELDRETEDLFREIAGDFSADISK